ncbi:MAG TPA: VTT domain-containing protein [Dehalococcoidales bacterium]|nr:VTT domain-containing protein [Dehalococcoidales bacterium]
MMERKVTETSKKRAYIMGLVGIIATLLMATAVIWFWEFIRAFEAYGYTGAFLISILGGATIIVPVPMLVVVFALGGVMKFPVFVGIAAGLGETLGALTIYMTGYGGGTPVMYSRHGKIQAVYSRMMHWMERRGSLILFALSAVLNPFFYPAALAAGALRFGIKRYFIICWAGKTIKGLTVAYAGFWGLRGLMRMLGMPV